MKRLFILLPLFLVVCSLFAQSPLNNRVIVRNQGNIDNHTGVKQVLISIPEALANTIMDGASIVFDSVTRTFKLEVIEGGGGGSGDGFFGTQNATGNTQHLGEDYDFTLTGVDSLTFSGQQIVLNSSGDYILGTLPEDDTTGAAIYRLALIDDAGDYKLRTSVEIWSDNFTGLVNFSGTNNPTITTYDPLTNFKVITAEYSDVGTYIIHVEGYNYATDKIVAFFTPAIIATPIVYTISPVDDFGGGSDLLFLETFDALGMHTDITGQGFLEIRIYRP